MLSNQDKDLKDPVTELVVIPCLIDLGVVLMRITMSKKQLVALFLCSLVSTTLGYGLMPLIPVYITRELGATPSVTGFLLAFTFVAMALGTFTAGGLSDKLQRRKPLIIAGGLGTVLIIGLMGQTTTIWLIALLTAVTRFLIGMGTVLVSILVGLFADPAERGRIFGIISITEGLGAIIGGLSMGRIADRFGYPTLFVIIALFCLLQPVSALFLKDKVVQTEKSREESKAGNKKTYTRLGRVFFIFLFAHTLSGIVIWVASLGRSLTMTDLGFTSAAISSTIVVGGVVSLPIRPLFGWLSDRLDRLKLLILCYLIAALAMAVLAIAITLVQFWMALSLLYISMIGGAVGAALVTDLIPSDSLGVALSLFRALTWGMGMIGYMFTGYAIEQLGRTTTYLMTAVFPLIAIFLLYSIRHTVGQQKGLEQTLLA